MEHTAHRNATTSRPNASHAVGALLDNVILNLRRYNLDRALALSELLMRDDTAWLVSAPLEVLRSAALRDAVSRGIRKIRRNAQASAIAEFKRARDIWDSARKSDDGGHTARRTAQSGRSHTVGS